MNSEKWSITKDGLPTGGGVSFMCTIHKGCVSDRQVKCGVTSVKRVHELLKLKRLPMRLSRHSAPLLLRSL